MAALPCYVATSHIVATAWTPEYETRAWCQVELMMAHAFATTGDRILVVPEKYIYKKGKRVKVENFYLINPIDGILTNPDDRKVIDQLQSVAQSSEVYTCRNNFIRQSTTSCFMSVCCNICICCQLCGYLPYCMKRNMKFGEAKIKKYSPR